MLDLELTPDLEADSLIRCLKQFISRRGKPRDCQNLEMQEAERLYKKLCHIWSQMKEQSSTGSLVGRILPKNGTERETIPEENIEVLLFDLRRNYKGINPGWSCIK